MSRHLPRFAAALLLLAPAVAGLAADKDLYGDPLPKGATGRLGTVRLRNTSYAVALLSPDAKTLYLTSSTGVKLLNPTTGAVIGKLGEQPNGNLVALSADGKRGIQNTFDAVVVWDTASGKTLAKVAARSSNTDWGASLSADGTVLAVGGFGDSEKKQHAKVTVWNVTTNKEITSITAPQNQFAQVALAPDGKAVAIWGNHFDSNMKPEDQDKSPGRYVYFFDAAGGKELSKVRVAGYSPQAVAIGPAGMAAVSAGDGAIDLVSLKTGESKAQLLGRSRMGRFVTFSPDGSVIASTADDGAVQLWGAADGSRIATVEPPVPGVHNTRVRMLDNEKGVAWGNRGLATFVWEVPSGKPLGPVEGHTSTVTSIVATPDGKHVLTASESGGALRWELATSKLTGEVAFRHPNPASIGYAPGAHFSRDGKTALIHDSSNSVGVFDVATGLQWYAIPLGPYAFTNQTFSADGSKIVTIYIPSDSTKKKPSQVTVLDTVSGKRLGAVDLIGYSRLAATVTPDGKHLITAGSKVTDKGAETFVTTGWDLTTGAKKGELAGKSQYTQPQVIAAPDNKTAAVATGDGKVIAVNFLEGKQVRTYDVGDRGHNTQMALAHDGKRFAVASQPNYAPETTSTIVVFEWANGTPVQTLTVPGFPPQALAFTANGKQLLTSAADSSVTVWELGK